MRELKILVLLSHLENALSIEALKRWVGSSLEQYAEAVNPKVLHRFEHRGFSPECFQIQIYRRKFPYQIGERWNIPAGRSKVHRRAPMDILHVWISSQFLQNVK
jgi:hypothetical protein